MKALCPNNPFHNRFITIIHVAQDVIVTSDGGFVDEVATLETVSGPDAGNTWTCADCDTEAVVTS